MDNQNTENIITVEQQEWKWCLVGNIVQDREYGEDHEIKHGTKHFSPGTKVYCAPAHWGDGYEQVVVIGKHRGSPKYIEIIMSRKFIENYRCQKVFRPAVLKLMNNSRWGFWNNTDSTKEWIFNAMVDKIRVQFNIVQIPGFKTNMYSIHASSSLSIVFLIFVDGKQIEATSEYSYRLGRPSIEIISQSKRFMSKFYELMYQFC